MASSSIASTRVSTNIVPLSPRHKALGLQSTKAVLHPPVWKSNSLRSSHPTQETTSFSLPLMISDEMLTGLSWLQDKLIFFFLFYFPFSRLKTDSEQDLSGRCAALITMSPLCGSTVKLRARPSTVSLESNFSSYGWKPDYNGITMNTFKLVLLTTSSMV